MKIHILNLEREARAEGLQQGLEQGRAESDAKYESMLKETETKYQAALDEKDTLIARLKAELAAKQNG